MSPTERNDHPDQSVSIAIRLYRPDDLATIERLTVEGFVDVGIQYLIEQRWPGVSRLTWGERKWLGTASDIAQHPEWCYVAEIDGAVVGYATLGLSDQTRQGQIRDLAVDTPWRGKGIGRQLIQHSLEIFRQNGMTLARIETLSVNAIGAHLYPSLGFELFTTQNYYAMPLD